MFASAEFWVAISFILFVLLIVYYRIPTRVTSALDNRAREIERDLEEARRLREEAQSILADYQRRQRDAEKEAADIIALAEREARSYAEESRKAFDEMLERRRRLAEDKIARAEAKATDEVRALSVDTAIRAAENLIANNLDPKTARKLLDNSIAEIEKRSVL